MLDIKCDLLWPEAQPHLPKMPETKLSSYLNDKWPSSYQDQRPIIALPLFRVVAGISEKKVKGKQKKWRTTIILSYPLHK